MGGTVACALAIGYLMQNGSADPGPAPEKVAATNQASVLAGLEAITLTSSPSSDAVDEPPLSTTTPPRRAEPTPPANCALSARAMASANATARLLFRAPCHPHDRVEILHSGLTFTAVTDARGALDLTVPALSEYAIFLISLDDQKGTVATTHVQDITEFERVALQWQGKTEIQLHALEFGASYGEQGHVWASPDASGAGSVVHLGQPDLADARQVQIYSYPSGSESPDGEIALSVEAEVTPANCGSDLNIQTLELRADRRLRSRDLTVTLPDCSGSDDFLVLNNLLQDLTIAAR